MPVKKYQEFIPHSTLQDFVKRFWILEKEYTAEDEIEEVTPDACVELIINCGNPYSVIGGSTKRELPNACLVGLLTKPLRLRAEGLVKIVAVRFFAWGALAFLKNSAGRTDVAEVDLDPTWQRVVQRAGGLVHRDNYQSAVEEIEDFLIGLRLNVLFDPKQVRTAAKLLYHARGQFRVAELADHCHLSMRQLQRQFDETTGVSPKVLARAIRFESIRERLMFNPDANLTDLATNLVIQTRRISSKISKLSPTELRGSSLLKCGNSRIFSEKTRTSCFYNRRPPCPITMRTSCSKKATHKGDGQ